MSDWKRWHVYQLLLQDNQELGYPWFVTSDKMYRSVQEYNDSRPDHTFRAIDILHATAMPFDMACFINLYGGPAKERDEAARACHEQIERNKRREEYERLQKEFEP
jgi:hypothetical protein